MKCESCGGETFRRHNAKERIYVCEYCGKVYFSDTEGNARPCTDPEMLKPVEVKREIKNEMPDDTSGFLHSVLSVSTWLIILTGIFIGMTMIFI